jgi:hypothetical protein
LPGALLSVCLASFFPFRFHFPASLCSTGVTPLHRSYGGSDSCMPVLSNRHCLMQVSLLHVSGLLVPFRLQPPFRPPPSLWHATPQRGGLVPTFSELRASPFTSGLACLTGRIEFTWVGQSPPALRTGYSPPAAFHLASLRRSCSRLQVGERVPEEDSHLSDQTHSQTH